MKRAATRDAVVKQLRRFERLLDSWAAKAVKASKQVENYRSRTAYYRKRLDEMEEAEVARRERMLAELRRSPRPVDCS